MNIQIVSTVDVEYIWPCNS